MHAPYTFRLLPILFTLFVPLYTLEAMAQAQKGNEVSISGSVMHFNYKEWDDSGKLLDQEDGFLPGFLLGLNQKTDSWLIAENFTYHGAEVNYTGQTQTGIPITTHTKQQIADIAMHAEYWIVNKQSLNYALYFGAGYHFWDRNIHPTTTAGGAPVSGLHEIYSWWSGFLGMKAEIYQSDTSIWQLDARLTHTINPQISIDFNGQYDNATLGLGERTGFRLSIPSKYSLNSTTSLNIEPYVESFEFGRSSTSPLTSNGTTIGTVFEPYSQTINYGLTVGISQHF